MTLANRIRSRMTELDLTQEALANRANISQGMVYKLVSGKAKSTSKIVNLAMALECPVEWLATGHDSSQSGVREDGSNYTQAKSVTKKAILRQVGTLPAKEQKAIALAILDSLIERD